MYRPCKFKLFSNIVIKYYAYRIKCNVISKVKDFK